MTGWEVLTLLVTGGVIGAIIKSLADIVIVKIKTSSEERTVMRKRSHDLADKRLQDRKDAYRALLEEMNFAVLHRVQGGGDYSFGEEEARRRMKMFAQVDMHASTAVKGLSAKVASFLRRDITEAEHVDMISAIQDMAAQMRRELGEE